MTGVQTCALPISQDDPKGEAAERPRAEVGAISETSSGLGEGGTAASATGAAGGSMP